MEVLLIVAISAANIFCFLVGARVGQKVAKGEPVELPKDPLQAIRDSQDRKEAKRKQSRVDTMLRNIDKYDGTPAGQEDIPR
jgi:hypothetical protein